MTRATALEINESIDRAVYKLTSAAKFAAHGEDGVLADQIWARIFDLEHLKVNTRDMYVAPGTEQR